MRRRHFINSVAATTLVGCQGGNDSATDGDARPDIQHGIDLDLAEVLRAYFGEGQIPDVRLVGSAYARRFDTDEDYADDLTDVVSIVGASGTIDEAVDALRARADDDFVAADMVVVDGWALGITEARLSATADYVDA
ncbi:MAG: hypothetical protein AAF799_01075 [Myxococcota bacterium]